MATTVRRADNLTVFTPLAFNSWMVFRGVQVLSCPLEVHMIELLSFLIIWLCERFDENENTDYLEEDFYNGDD